MGLTGSAWAADTSEPVLEATVGGVLRQAAETAPGRVGLVAARIDPSLRRRWTFEELLADAEAVANALLGRFQPGERVAVWAPNVPEWVLLEYGAALAEAHAVDHHLRPHGGIVAPYRSPRHEGR